MRRLSILISVLALAALNVAFVPASVAAQATPDAGKERAVPAEDCQVEPRSSDELFALIGLAEGAEAATPAARTPVPAPPWIAADKETAAAAEATAHEWVACINADDNLRLAALMTDAALTRFFAGVQAAGADRGSAGDLGWDAGAACGEGAGPTRDRDRRLSVGRRADRRFGRHQRAGRCDRADRSPCCSSSPRLRTEC